MGKRENIVGTNGMGPLSLDFNARVEKLEEFQLYELIEIGIKAGRTLFFGISYSIKRNPLSEGEFVLRNHWKQMYFHRVLHLAFILNMVLPVLTERSTLSPCCLVNMIKEGLFIVLICGLIAAYYCTEIKGRRLEDGIVPIFKECVTLQNKYKLMGVRFPSRSKIRAFGWFISIASCVVCVLRQILFSTTTRPWYIIYAKQISRTVTFGVWGVDNSTENQDIAFAMGCFGIVFNGLMANFWFFAQVIHFFFVFTIWLVFHELNKAWLSGHFHVRHLPDVIDLHFHSTKLLNKINELIAPITFWSVVYNIVCLCFWMNYIAVDFKLKVHFIAAFCNILKMAVELSLEADVNSKAHRISDWLEECCTEIEKFPQVDRYKFAVFTSQIYNKDNTGFRGLNYFVVTPRLAMTVVGIVLTYSVAVNQFCHSM